MSMTPPGMPAAQVSKQKFYVYLNFVCRMFGGTYVQLVHVCTYTCLCIMICHKLSSHLNIDEKFKYVNCVRFR